LKKYYFCFQWAAENSAGLNVNKGEEAKVYPTKTKRNTHHTHTHKESERERERGTIKLN